MIGTLLRGRRGRLALLGVLLAASSALPLAGPQLLRAFIDRAVAGRPIAALSLIAGAYVAVALTRQALAVTAAYGATQLAWTAGNDLRERLLRHTLELDLAFSGTHPPGELIERTDGDVTALSSFVSSFVLRIVGSALTLIGVLVVVLLEDWQVGLALAAFAAVAAFTIARLRDSAVPQATQRRAAAARLFGELEERLAGAEDLRANGGGAHAVRRFHQATAALYGSARRAALGTRRIYVITMAVFVAGGVLSLLAGAALYRSGAITLGTVYLLFRYTSMLREPLEQISNELQNVQTAVAGYVRVGQLLDERPTVGDAGRRTLPAGALPVELDGVGFAYREGVPVLEGVTLRLPAGRVLGVVGHSGSGKTTLTRLLLRLADPTEGVVRVGGTDLREVRLAALRARVGLVTQDVQLFDASVRDNLTLFGAVVADDSRLVEVLDSLGLGGWRRALPDGLDTPLGPGGAGLSAGEAQLLAFARVFLRDPGLVILDEAASRVDPATEARIERALDTLLAGRTAIVIAHRLATVGRADEILVLEEGRVAEHGARPALAADPGSRFARLLAGNRAVAA
ncbi:MAG TPA: ABC transporter ATP-binding protein [Geminicoccaceae bacterium]|nr:ABC transporter ATP-binding protein [Geminicoccaceae bacterium]